MDYFSQPRAEGVDRIEPTTPFADNAQPSPGPRAPEASRQRPVRLESTNAPSVRLRRLPSAGFLQQLVSRQQAEERPENAGTVGRRRSSSDPTRGQRRGSLGATNMLAQQPMSPVREEGSGPIPGLSAAPPPVTGGRPRGSSNASSNGRRGLLHRGRSPDRPPTRGSTNEYEQEVVDLFDVVDPEISTLTTLNNVQNSLFIPYLGRHVNRTSTYNLSRMPTGPTPTRRAPPTAPSPRPPRPESSAIDESDQSDEERDDSERRPIRRSMTLQSVLTSTEEGEGHNYAVLPHGVRLEGWTEEEKDELNDYVRHLMHSRREGFKRSMRGFKQYVRTPLGAFVTVYSFLLTFWGAAWVLFLIGWISVGGRKDYFVNIADSILVALFNLVGIGLAPWRAVDTYHMAYIAYYHRLALRLRKKRALPKLEDHNDLPETAPDVDLEKQEEETGLTPEQLAILKHHQEKFSKSHTFYKPHETVTHHAFSFKLLIAAVTLLDCHSMFQFALAGVTWGMDYKIRPIAATTAILCCSITCNISAGVVITIGDRQTRKKKVIEQMFRQELTQQAIEKFERKGRVSMAVDRDEAKRGDEESNSNGTPKRDEELKTGEESKAS